MSEPYPIFENIPVSSGERFTLRRDSINDFAGLSVITHFHVMNEIMWFRRAGGSFVIQDRVWPIKNNTLVYVPSLFMHEMRLLAGDEHLRYLLQYEESWLEEMNITIQPVMRIQPMVAYLTGNEAGRVENLLDWACEKMVCPAEFPLSLLRALVIFTTSQLSADAELAPAALFPQQADKLLQLVSRLDEQKEYAISAAHAAQRCGWSDSYFSRLFRQTFGQTFKEFVLKRKISFAIDLLINSDLTVSDIAYQTSFTDCAYFCSRFKHIVGMSPKKFKENIYRHDEMTSRRSMGAAGKRHDAGPRGVAHRPAPSSSGVDAEDN